ncbi:MAG TPA: N-6 DNA methylase, partial [Terriglobales bacterium]|nr:N-6 DNA methylase [Terriglobales bacterium]
MSAARPLPLPDPPCGFRYYRSRRQLLQSPEIYAYQHMLLRAWEEMHLSGVLTLNGIPTVYLREEAKPVTAEVAATAQLQFWNQGVATVLLLRDPQHVRVFSSMTRPTRPETATDPDIEWRLVEKIELAALAGWAQRFYVQIGNGHYYASARETKFDPAETVDAYLLDNLAAVRDELVHGGLDPRIAHAFLGRLLFTCYLCDRGIIELSNYFKGKSWQHLHELLEAFADPGPALYQTLFPALKRDFNGSMFDDDLVEESSRIQPAHFQVIRRFLSGDDIARGHGQRSLGFWAYDFKFIPVETISAIYENFLEKEDGKGKRDSGAFYTPRFLAEMAVDLALESAPAPYSKTYRFIDPACGSGIFLVLLFNRLAAEWRAALKGDPSPQARAEALLDRLDRLCGVDKNPTACRIACFSLYLAFLDQFDPPDVRAYKLNTGKRLPNIL